MAKAGRRSTDENALLMAVPSLMYKLEDMYNAENKPINVHSCIPDQSLIECFREAPSNVSSIVIPQEISLELLAILITEIKELDKDELVTLLIIGHINPEMLAVLRQNIIFQSLSIEEAETQLRPFLAATDSEFNQVKSLIHQIETNRSITTLMSNGNFEFQTLDECNNLTTFLAANCPHSRQIALGLSELMINAVEHGNLEIDFEQKTELLKNGRWREEIDLRSMQDKYKDRKVIVSYKRASEKISITISDEGKGFDWRNYLDFSQDRLSMKHGRGIAIAKETVFQDLIYNEKGNSVTAIVDLKSETVH